MPASVAALIDAHRDEIMAAMAASLALLLLAQAATLVRLGRLGRLYRKLTRNTSGGNMEEILHNYMDRVERTASQTEKLEARTARLEESVPACLQRLGLVRYDAFEEVGGEQSFTVAVMDARENGVVVSSVYSRQDVRVYAKAVRDGRPTHPLSREEQQAVEQARASGRQDRG